MGTPGWESHLNNFGVFEGLAHSNTFLYSLVVVTCGARAQQSLSPNPSACLRTLGPFGVLHARISEGISLQSRVKQNYILATTHRNKDVL